MLKEEIIEEMNTKNLPLARKIREENNIRQSDSSEDAYAFIITGLRAIVPSLLDSEIGDAIVDARNDGQFDAIVIDNQNQKVLLFDFKGTDEFNYNHVNLFKESIKRNLLTPQQDLSALNPRARALLETSREKIRSGYTVQIFVVRKGKTSPTPSVEGIMNRLKNTFDSIEEIEFYDSHNLTDKFLDLSSRSFDFTWSISIVAGNNESDSPDDKIVIRDSPGGQIKTLVCRLPLKSLVQLQEDFQRQGFDLFDKNVRGFQENSQLKTGILDSIASNSQLFHLFHNGITFSCQNISLSMTSDFSILKPQIINGCQTISTIYKHRNELTEEHLQSATVLCKFHALEDIMIEKVCEATNTQVRINLWDLRSNDEIQKLFERALRLKDIDYDRKRKRRRSGTQKLLITDLAQWIFSCKYEKPAEAKNKKVKLFDLLPEDPIYKKIFSEQFKLKDLVAICSIGFFVNEKISAIPQGQRDYEKYADFHFMAALYKLLNREDSLEDKYARIDQLLQEVISELRIDGDSAISVRKIFTQMDMTWAKLKDKLETI